MAERYPTEWSTVSLGDYTVYVCICSYSNLVRHLSFEEDDLRQKLIRHVTIYDGVCSAGTHCLALDCPLNHTEDEHLAHMLDMPFDEEADEELKRVWGRDTVAGCYVEMAKRLGRQFL